MATAGQLLATITTDCTTINNEIKAIRADVAANTKASLAAIEGVIEAMGRHVTEILASAQALAAQVPTAPLTITTTALPKATIGVSYSAQLAAAGGLPPYTFDLKTALSSLISPFAAL